MHPEGMHFKGMHLKDMDRGTDIPKWGTSTCAPR